jgi:hypothetical protein
MILADVTLTLNVANTFLTFVLLTAWGATACWLSFKAGERNADPSTAVEGVTAKRTWQLFVGSMLFFYLLLSGLYRVVGL